MPRKKNWRTLESYYDVDRKTGCWNWNLVPDYAGYGRWPARGGKGGHAHRRVYEILVGPVSTENHIDHLCRNRRCVNPEHLEEVSPAENARRRTSTKLNPEKNEQIKELKNNGSTQEEIAKIFRVHQSTISRVLNSKRWK